MEIIVCAVYYDKTFTGFLMKGKLAYSFAYYSGYINQENAQPISLSLPLQDEPFYSNRLFPFFEGLLSEGWLKKIQATNQKIDERDSFSLLIKNGQDLIGSISIIPIESNLNNDL
jgi:serine/threonine-protein kinase HipA